MPYPVKLAEGGAWHDSNSSKHASFLVEDGTHTTYANRLTLANASAFATRGDVLPITNWPYWVEGNIVDLDVNSTWYVSVWVDWNKDGAWSASEKVISNDTSSAWELGIPVPNDFEPGTTFGRYRVSTTPNLNPGGSAPDGYVDDFEVYVSSTDPVSWAADDDGFVGLAFGRIRAGRGISVFDVNRDSTQDILRRGNSVYLSDTARNGWEIGLTAGAFDEHTDNDFLIGDVNGDGNNDLVEFVHRSTNFSTNNRPLEYVAATTFDSSNNRSSKLTLAVDGSNLEYITDSGLVDYNGDGRDDIITIFNHSSGDNTVWMPGQTDLGFGAAQALDPVFQAIPIEQYDLSGDGLVDLVSREAIYLRGQNGFTRIPLPKQARGSQVRVTQLDNDIHPEIIVASYDGLYVFEYESGTLFTRYIVPTTISPRAFVVGDINGDGNIDLVTHDYDAGIAEHPFLVWVDFGGDFAAEIKRFADPETGLTIASVSTAGTVLPTTTTRGATVDVTGIPVFLSASDRRMLSSAFLFVRSQDQTGNVPPTLNQPNDVGVHINAPLQSVVLSGITAGGDEDQPLRVVATSSNTTLIPNPTVNYTTANSTGSLAFKPSVNRTGQSTITVTVEDGGLDNNLSTTADNLKVSRSFTIFVNSGNYSFMEAGRTLQLRLKDANQNVQARATASGYQFTLNTGVWSGFNSSRVSGSGTSVLTVSSTGKGYYQAIRIDDDSTGNRVNFIDSGSSTYSASILVNLDSLSARNVAFTGATKLTGSASLEAVTTRQVNVTGASTVVSTQHGNLLFSANQQQTPRTDIFRGISILDATVEVTGGGDLTILGRAGTTSSQTGGFIYGIRVINALVTGGLAGTTVSMVGTGGASSGDQNHGIQLHNLNGVAQLSRVSSRGGNIRLVGTGDGSGASGRNAGIRVGTGSSVFAGGTGHVELDGRGGVTEGDLNVGLWIVGKSETGVQTRVGTSGGNITLKGTGAGQNDSRFNHGVEISNSAIVNPGGSGTLSVNGFGGGANGIENHGVQLWGDLGTATLTSSGGSITILGTGGGAGASQGSAGVNLQTGGQIVGPATAALQIYGQGGTGGGTNNQGVWVRGMSSDGRRSTITSLGGDVYITGLGGGVGNAGFNRGVAVWHGGLVTAGGDGNVSVVGTGASTEGPYHVGVSVSSAITGQAEIKSSGGDVLVRGIGGAGTSSNYNRGTEVLWGGVITAGGSGSVTVEGTGGSSAGNENYGIFVWGMNDSGQVAKVTSSGGAITLNGTGGGGGATGAGNAGVNVSDGGRLLGPSANSLTITGTGGSGGGDFNRGVFVGDGRDSANLSSITSSGGSILISGTGGGSGDSSFNNGVAVSNGGLIQPGGSGTLTIEGQGGLSGGNGNDGIQLWGLDGSATITSSGGAITLTGNGGGTGASGGNEGVHVETGGEIVGPSSALLKITGMGGLGGGDSNRGVLVNTTSNAGLRSTIKSLGGNIAIVAVGRGIDSANNNHGIAVSSGGLIQPGGSGTLTIDGQGGATQGHNNRGIQLWGGDAAGTITSSGGAIILNGTGGGTGASIGNSGVHIESGSEIIGPSTSLLSVVGSGGNGSGDYNRGIVVVGVSSAGKRSSVTSLGGSIELLGTGGGRGSSSNNKGVAVSNGGLIQPGGSGTLTLEGQGGHSSGNWNRGVELWGRAGLASITTSGGDMTLIGTGGGTAESSANDGVYVGTGAELVGPASASIEINGTGGITSGDFNRGIYVSGKSDAGISSVISSEGILHLTGTGGGTGSSSFNRGFDLDASGRIELGASGVLNVTATGGSTDGVGNHGINIAGLGTKLHSLGGDVTLQGIGKGSSSSASSSNRGISIEFNAQVSVEESGNLALTGTGGLGGADVNYGVVVSNATDATNPTSVRVVHGAMTIQGVGGGSGSSGRNVGVLISGDAIVDASGIGTIALTGQGGLTTGNTNRGIGILGSETLIRSATGTITLNGTGGGQSASAFNQGVLISGGASVESTSNANLFVTGQGGLSSGFQNYGVQITGHTPNKRARLYTSGNLEVTGVGGGVAGSRYNDGVRLWDEGLIETTGTGQIKVNGNGGGQSGIENNGVGIFDRGQILSKDGAIAIEGIGGADVNTASLRNFGIELRSGGQVKSSGAGNITIDGKGGVGSGGEHHGVALRGVGSDGSAPTIASQTGSIQVKGVAGNGNSGQGIYLDEIGTISAGDKLILEGAGNADAYGLLASGASTRLAAIVDVTVHASFRVNGLDADFTANPVDLTNAVWSVNMTGSTPEQQYDQMDVIGSIDLTGLQLKLIGEHSFTLGESLTLIDNDGTDPLQGQLRLDGTTATLPEGSTIAFGGQTLQVSYVGGDGNDLTVTAVNLPPWLDPIVGLTIPVNSSEQTVDLAGIVPGGEELQPLRVTAVSDNPGLIPDPSVTYTSAESTGRLRFTPVADQIGTAIITVTVEDGGLDGDLATTADNATFSREFMVHVRPLLDFGDAPASYPVTLAQDGARHEPLGPRLGGTRDAEIDGAPSSDAGGDGVDEDGVLFGSIAVGDSVAALNVSLQNATSGRVDAWVDFNRDGQWDASEKILDNVLVEDELQTLNYAVPTGLTVGDTHARVRLSSSGGLEPIGFATDGEVEDYRIRIATAPSVVGVVINDASAQRSAVRSLQVQFDQTVEIPDPPAAFRITRSGSTESVGIATAASVQDGKTLVNLTFNPGPLVTDFGSLIDGDYQLLIDGSEITYQGVALDGDNDGQSGGDYLFGNDEADKFFRKYGDMNGNQAVDLLDFAEFRRMFGSSAGGDTFDSSLDADGDNSIGLLDFAAFRRNFGT